MVATALASTHFPTASLTPDHQHTKASKAGGGAVNFRGLDSKSGSSSLQAKKSVQAPHTVNVSATTNSPSDSVKISQHEMISVSSSRTSMDNRVADWNTLLGAITAILVRAEKPLLSVVDSKPKRPETPVLNPFHIGSIVGNGRVFRQNFPIRSYEIGANGSASIKTLMNHLQETSLSHCKGIGLLEDGFGSTPQMVKRNLIWVVAKMQVLIDRYPTWGDIVQIDSWIGAAGRNGMSRDWVVTDSRSGEILARASSVWVMMNKETRRLSKIPDEVREEIQPCFVDTPRVVEKDTRRLPKLNSCTAHSIVRGLVPRWADLDVNQHVNNVKYISWILESVPLAILESYDLSSMILEYRRECGKDSVLQSLCDIPEPNSANFFDSGIIECQHMLCLEDGAEIMRGRTQWTPRGSNTFGKLNHIPSGGSRILSQGERIQGRNSGDT